MPKNTKEKKLESIEEQIKRLQQKKKDLEKKMKENIGKVIIEEWEIEDEETAIMVIQSLKEEAKKLTKKTRISNFK